MSNAAQELRAQIIMAVARAKNPSGNSAEKSAYFHAAHAYTHALEMLYADEGYEVQDGIAPTVGMRAENYLGWVRNFLSAEVFRDLGFEKRYITGHVHAYGPSQEGYGGSELRVCECGARSYD